MRWIFDGRWKYDKFRRNNVLSLYSNESSGNLSNDSAVYGDKTAHVPCLGDTEGCFAAQVEGDSMSPRFNDGDYVVFSSVAKAKSGQVCLVRLKHSNSDLFRLYIPEANNMVRLQPINAEYQCQIVGRDSVIEALPAIYRIEKL